MSTLIWVSNYLHFLPLLRDIINYHPYDGVDSTRSSVMRFNFGVDVIIY